MRILYVEQDEVLATALRADLKRLGFAVDHVKTASDGLSAAASVSYGSIVLDLHLPDLGGLAALERMRAAGSSTPVLITSASKTTGMLIGALNAGADDFLSKPFDIRELAARLRALLRRPRDLISAKLDCGNLRLIAEERIAIVNGLKITLPRRQTSILEQLLRNIGRTIAKSAIEDRLYAFGEEVASNAVEVHVHLLRKRLAATGANVRIDTIRGIGYVLRPPPRRLVYSEDPNHRRPTQNTLIIDQRSGLRDRRRTGTEVRNTRPGQET